MVKKVQSKIALRVPAAWTRLQSMGRRPDFKERERRERAVEGTGGGERGEGERGRTADWTLDHSEREARAPVE
jgi:hypothetical protein